MTCSPRTWVQRASASEAKVGLPSRYRTTSLGPTGIPCLSAFASRSSTTTSPTSPPITKPRKCGALAGLSAPPEVLPVFAGIGLGDEALAYRNSVIERFRNPFLNHFLADIHTNHAAKKARRFGGIIALKGEHGLDVPQPRLTAALKETN